MASLKQRLAAIRAIRIDRHRQNPTTTTRITSATNTPRPPINDNPYTNGEWAFFDQNKSKFTQTIIIVGAAHDEDYINAVSDQVQFHLFEPNNDRYQTLLTTLGHKPNVTINKCGLADKVGQVQYYADTLSCVQRVHDIQSKSVPVIIPLRTLDDYCAEKKITHVDFLKIDTEGYELPILIGGRQSLINTDFVQFEYGGCWKDTRTRLQTLYQQFPRKKISELMPDGSYVHRPTAIEDYRYTNYIMKSLMFNK
jgi:FkbM family methyltransferase